MVVDLFKKLKTKGVGVNNVEVFARRDAKEGNRREERRRRTVRDIMKGKLREAEEELRWSKEVLKRKEERLVKRFGENREIMAGFRNILKEEPVRVWKEGKMQNRNKVKGLSRRWGGRETRLVEGLWRGIKIGDEELGTRGGDVEEEGSHPHKYGGATTNEDEDAILKLPHKFTTYESIDLDKIKTSTEIMKDKIRWELRARDEREGEAWTKDWQREQQDEKKVIRAMENKMEFSRRRVTDMPTNRDVNIPEPAEPDVEVVLSNISTRINEATQNDIKAKCDKKGNILETNLKPNQQRGLKSLVKRIRDKEIVAQKTDKGGDIAINTPANYINSMDPHL